MILSRYSVEYNTEGTRYRAIRITIHLVFIDSNIRNAWSECIVEWLTVLWTLQEIQRISTTQIATWTEHISWKVSRRKWCHRIEKPECSQPSPNVCETNEMVTARHVCSTVARTCMLTNWGTNVEEACTNTNQQNSYPPRICTQTVRHRRMTGMIR